MCIIEGVRLSHWVQFRMLATMDIIMPTKVNNGKIAKGVGTSSGAVHGDM